MLRFVTASYWPPGRVNYILRNLTFGFAGGERVAIIGPSGCGKSTIFELLTRFAKVTEGEITLDGKSRSEKEWSALFGYLPQDPMELILPWRTCLDNVNLARKLRSKIDAEWESARIELMKRTHLMKCASSYPVVLSGGERRRLALSMIMAFQPRVLLLDEPFSGLDLNLRFDMWQVLFSFWSSYKPTLAIITHNLDEAAVLCDRVIFLSVSAGVAKVSSELLRDSFFTAEGQTPMDIYRDKEKFVVYRNALDESFWNAISQE